MNTDKDQPAFPVIKTTEAKTNNMANAPSYGDVTSQGGLTKREYFAARAMQALLSCYPAQQDICNKDPRYKDTNFAEVIAINSTEFADALIKELNKEK